MHRTASLTSDPSVQPLWSWTVGNEIVNLFYDRLSGYTAWVKGDTRPLSLESGAVTLLSQFQPSQMIAASFFSSLQAAVNHTSHSLNLTINDFLRLYKRGDALDDETSFAALKAALQQAGCVLTEGHRFQDLNTLAESLQIKLTELQTFLSAQRQVNDPDLDVAFNKIAAEVTECKDRAHQAHLILVDLDTKLPIAKQALQQSLITSPFALEGLDALFRLVQRFKNCKSAFQTLQEEAQQRIKTDEKQLEVITQQKKQLADNQANEALAKARHDELEAKGKAEAEAEALRKEAEIKKKAYLDNLAKQEKLQNLQSEFNLKLLNVATPLRISLIRSAPIIAKKTQDEQIEIYTALLSLLPQMTEEEFKQLKEKYHF